MPDLSQARTQPPVSEDLWLRLLPNACRWVLRGDAAVRAAAENALGVPVPAAACRAGVTGERAALWLGPDEWLLLAPDADGPALAASLETALAGLPHSLMDVSHRQSGLTVSGPEAVAVLNAGCPLDLDPDTFPNGMCTRTVFAKASITLWRTGAQAFRVEAWRSFLPYVWGYLTEAAREFSG